MKAKYEFEVPNDFEIGESCIDCPLNKYHLNIETHNEWLCGVTPIYSNCPLKLETTDNKIEHENELYGSDV